MSTDTDTKVANRALIAIGQTQVLSDLETDNTTTGKTINRVYQDSVDTVLQAIDWNFNARRVALPAHASTPAFDFAYQYGLPADYLKVRELYNGSGTIIAGRASDGVYFGEDRWRVEAYGDTDAEMVQVIVCDIGAPLKIVYSRRMNNLARWSPLAIEALVARVAMLIAMPITQKASTAQSAKDMYDEAISKASGRDAQEASATQLDDGSWVQSRW